MFKSDFIKFTDTMIHVPSVQEAMSFWTFKMGFEYIEGGFGWMSLEDKKTKQKIVLTEENFGSPWALAFSTNNFDETLERLAESKITIKTKVITPGGFKHALCYDELGIPLLVYVRSE